VSVARRGFSAPPENRSSPAHDKRGVITSFNDPRSDGDLIADIAVGDADALVVLYDRHAAWLLLRLKRRSSDETLVDEV
jgi:hypothetical protein